MGHLAVAVRKGCSQQITCDQSLAAHWDDSLRLCFVKSDKFDAFVGFGTNGLVSKFPKGVENTDPRLFSRTFCLSHPSRRTRRMGHPNRCGWGKAKALPGTSRFGGVAPTKAVLVCGEGAFGVGSKVGRGFLRRRHNGTQRKIPPRRDANYGCTPDSGKTVLRA
jgi:hypothetical protein